MTIGHPRRWPGYPHHTGLISACCSSPPRFRHQLSSDPASRRAPLPRRMVPVITVHGGLAPLECISLLDTPARIGCPTGRVETIRVGDNRTRRRLGVHLRCEHTWGLRHSACILAI